MSRQQLQTSQLNFRRRRTNKLSGVRFTPGGIRPGASGHNVTFIHPKGNEASPIGGAGVLIELVQAPPDVITAMKK
jgi:lactoylglutathione lyase